jgi:hypothetical protein
VGEWERVKKLDDICDFCSRRVLTIFGRRELERRMIDVMIGHNANI